MSTLRRSSLRLTPFACALALALTLPAGARAQAAPAVPGGAEAGQMKDLPLSAEERRVYVGSYTIALSGGNHLPFRVYEEQGVLKGQPGADDPKRILHQGNHVFHPEMMPEFTLTFKVENGRATGFTATMGGETHVGERDPDR